MLSNVQCSSLAHDLGELRMLPLVANGLFFLYLDRRMLRVRWESGSNPEALRMGSPFAASRGEQSNGNHSVSLGNEALRNIF